MLVSPQGKNLCALVSITECKQNFALLKIKAAQGAFNENRIIGVI